MVIPLVPLDSIPPHGPTERRIPITKKGFSTIFVVTKSQFSGSSYEEREAICHSATWNTHARFLMLGHCVFTTPVIPQNSKGGCGIPKWGMAKD